jgi:hypothetical protein
MVVAVAGPLEANRGDTLVAVAALATPMKAPEARPAAESRVVAASRAVDHRTRGA